jgi:hypothetical protein
MYTTACVAKKKRSIVRGSSQVAAARVLELEQSVHQHCQVHSANTTLRAALSAHAQDRSFACLCRRPAAHTDAGSDAAGLDAIGEDADHTGGVIERQHKLSERQQKELSKQKNAVKNAKKAEKKKAEKAAAAAAKAERKDR